MSSKISKPPQSPWKYAPLLFFPGWKDPYKIRGLDTRLVTKPTGHANDTLTQVGISWMSAVLW